MPTVTKSRRRQRGVRLDGVHAALIRRGITREEFAERADISIGTVNRITAGYPVNASTADRVGRTLRSIPCVVPDEIGVTVVGGGDGA